MCDDVLERVARDLFASELNVVLNISGGDIGQLGAFRQSARQKVL
jgi:hypothetical protein